MSQPFPFLQQPDGRAPRSARTKSVRPLQIRHPNIRSCRDHEASRSTFRHPAWHDFSGHSSTDRTDHTDSLERLKFVVARTPTVFVARTVHHTEHSGQSSGKT